MTIINNHVCSKNSTRVKFLKKKLKGSVGARRQMHFRKPKKKIRKNHTIGTHIEGFKLKCTESYTEKQLTMTIINNQVYTKNSTRVKFLKKKLKGSVGARRQMHFRKSKKI